jgi:hypothetical protein
MSQHTRRIHLSIIEILDGIWVDPQREFQWRERQSIFKSRDQICFPAEPLHLPAPKYEGGYGYDGEDDEAWSVLFACACHLRWPVEDRDEVWVEAGAAAYIALLGAEEEELRVEACAEALRAGMWCVGGS